MKIFTKEEAISKEGISIIKNLLIKGEIIIYPTDTLYGLGVRADEKDKVSKVFTVKKREISSPILIIVSSISDIERFELSSKPTPAMLEKILPGPYSVILHVNPRWNHLSSIEGKIGIRVIELEWLNKLLSELDFPITSTSANLTGENPPSTIDQINKNIKDACSIIVDFGELLGFPSTVIDFTIAPPKILRKGASDHKLDLLLK